MKLKFSRAFLVAVLALTLAGCGGGKAYPAHAITLVVPYGAGGSADLVGRKLAAGMSVALGQPITVLNQAGASGSLGCKTVLDAPADGYTLLLAADSLGTQQVMGISEMSYRDFAPILVAASDPKVIVVNKNSAYADMQALAADLTARPGKVRMSHTGPGGSGHVQGLIYKAFGMEAAMTSYSSGSECLLAVLGNQVDFTNANLSAVAGYLDSGDLRAVAISGAERLAACPGVPTLGELFPQMEEALTLPFTPLSLVARADTDPAVLEALRTAASQTVKGQEWLDFCKKNCLDKLYEQYPDPAAATAFYSRLESEVSWLLYDAGAAKYSPRQFDIPRAGDTAKKERDAG